MTTTNYGTWEFTAWNEIERPDDWTLSNDHAEVHFTHAFDCSGSFDEGTFRRNYYDAVELEVSTEYDRVCVDIPPEALAEVLRRMGYTVTR